MIVVEKALKKQRMEVYRQDSKEKKLHSIKLCLHLTLVMIISWTFLSNCRDFAIDFEHWRYQ